MPNRLDAALTEAREALAEAQADLAAMQAAAAETRDLTKHSLQLTVEQWVLLKNLADLGKTAVKNPKYKKESEKLLAHVQGELGLLYAPYADLRWRMTEGRE